MQNSFLLFLLYTNEKRMLQEWYEYNSDNDNDDDDDDDDDELY